MMGRKSLCDLMGLDLTSGSMMIRFNVGEGERVIDGGQKKIEDGWQEGFKDSGGDVGEAGAGRRFTLLNGGFELGKRYRPGG